MPNYAVPNSTVFAGNTPNAGTATYATVALVGAGSTYILNPPATTNLGTRRGKIYDLLVGTAGTPADFSYEWEVTRCTFTSTVVWLGSLSSVSSGFFLDAGDLGFSAFALNNSSAETNITNTGQVWYVGINQRASYRWVAAPGSELVWPATSSNGFALKTRSVSGGTAAPTATVMFIE